LAALAPLPVAPVAPAEVGVIIRLEVTAILHGWRPLESYFHFGLIPARGICELMLRIPCRFPICFPFANSSDLKNAKKTLDMTV